MGLYSSLRGRAGSVDVEKVTEQVEPFLLEDETIESAYKIFRDMIIFTNRRMVLVDVQGFTGKKKKFVSLPYKSITAFSVETAGYFDGDATLSIWTTHLPQDKPHELEFKKGDSIFDVQKSLVRHAAIEL